MLLALDFNSTYNARHTCQPPTASLLRYLGSEFSQGARSFSPYLTHRDRQEVLAQLQLSCKLITLLE